MKRLLLASVAALAVISTLGSANAADLSRRPMPAKAPAYVQAYNWTGGYVGINGGYGWGTSSFSGLAGSTNINGGLIGGTVGYNWQVGQLVYGLEGDIDWSNIKGTAPLGATNRNDWLGTARGRLGFAYDRFLPFITGGLAVGDIKTGVPGFGDTTRNKAGWTLGGGAEFALAGPWTAKVEYLYVDLGRGNSIGGTDANFHTNLVRAGLNYRF
jgi:outer membrane immunogenic protein